MSLAALKSKWTAFARGPRGKAALKGLNRLITLGILAFLIYKLTQIGWGKVWHALPRTPLFYLLFAVIYLTLPFCETIIYRMVWPVGFRESLLAFLRKRVYNEEVIGYSGEVYLFLWARDRLGTTAAEAFRVVRDVNIISTVASTSVAFGLVGVLVYTGALQLDALVGDVSGVYVLTGVVVAGALALAGWQFRRHIFTMPLRTAASVMGVHLMRLLAANALLVVQWAVVVPSISLEVWFTYLAVLIVLNRVPFLPSKDLFFVGLGVGLSSTLHVAEASVAGVFLASSVLTRLTNLVLLVLTQRFGADVDLERAAA